MTWTDVANRPQFPPVPHANAGGVGTLWPNVDAFLPADRAPGRLLLLSLCAGLGLDIGLRGGIANAVVVAGIAIVLAILLTDDRIQQPSVRWLVVAAAVPTVFLGVWSSPWVLGTNVLAICALLGLALAYSQSGSVWDTTPLRLVRRASGAVLRAAFGPLALRPLVKTVSGVRANRAGRIAVAVLMALPVLAIVVALLASGDAVFASLVLPDIDGARLVGHVALASFLALCVLCSVAGGLGDSEDDVPAGRFGVLEIATMLGLAAAVLALFAVSQLVALTDAGDRLVKSSGLTPAEYARSGFFQLCWATAVLLGFLALVQGLAAPHVLASRLVRALAGAVPLLTLPLVGVSLWRMRLYDDAFGLTMLRLWVVGAAVWMGALLLMMAGRNLGVGAQRHWVFGGAGAAALALVLVANVSNPEAFVVRHNVARADELDAVYLSELSDDAVPTLVGAVDDVTDPYARDRLTYLICGRQDQVGVAALNVATARAANARDDLCA